MPEQPGATTTLHIRPPDEGGGFDWRQPRELWVYRELLMAFVVNDLRFRYVGSSIGFFWTVVNPIIELITYTFVFNVLIGVRFHPAGGTVHYALFLFCGMITWFAVSDGLTRATTVMRDYGHLLKKVNFPALVLPAHVVISAVVNQALRTVILAIGAILFGEGLSVHFLLVPVFWVLQAIFVLGLAFFLSTAGVYFRDTIHWVNVVLLAWMFMTPIFYPPSVYPAKFNFLLQLNPLSHIVGVYQELILNHRLPHPNSMLVVVVCAGLALVVGFSIYAHHRAKFADLV
jgi:ABC-type polysaccharide/polyol phosphate export permease